MAKALGQIGPAIPGLVLRRVGLETALLEEQQVPAGHEQADVEGETELVLRRGAAHRLRRHQVGVDRLDVRIRHAGEMIIGKGGVEIAPLAVDALVHGPRKASSDQLPMPVSGSGVMLVE